jgi:gamma-glutamylputrescine oxidase
MTPTHVPSWYAASANAAPDHPVLQGEHSADVVVLGAGIAGLSTALELAERGYSVIVLEAERVGWGASGRSGGQAIFGYGCDISKIEAQLGHDDARKLFDWSVEGVDMIGARIRRYGIDCDWVPGHAHAAIKPRQVNELRQWQDDLQGRYGYQGTELWDQARLQQDLATERYRALLVDPRSGHLHPLNYTLGLARAATGLASTAAKSADIAAGDPDHRGSPSAAVGSAGNGRPSAAIRPGQVRIFAGSRVTRIEQGKDSVFHTASGSARGQFGVVAGNAWLKHLLPQLETRYMPVGTYICASAPLGADRAKALIRNNLAVADMNFVLDYFRLSSDQRMLFGGRCSYSTLDPPGLGASMRQRMIGVFPQLADVPIEYVWGGYLDITMNRAPHWGRIGSNLYFAQGFSGHGIAATGLAGRVIAEAIDGQAARLDVYQRIRHQAFPGGHLLRTPALVLAMLWYRIKDALP